MNLKHAALMCCALTLAACGGPSASQGVTKAKEQTGFFGSRNDDFNITTAEAFKGIDEVVIAGFTVSFYTYSTIKSKAGGGLMGSGFGGKSTAKSTLVGISDADMQKITDAAYKDFVAKLEAKGYKVADRSALVNSTEFAKATVKPSPWEDSSETLLTSGNKVKYFAPSSFKGIYVFPGTTPTSGFGMDNALTAAANYGKNNKANVLYVGLNVNFANAETYGSWATTTSNVTVGQGVAIIPGATVVGIIGAEQSIYGKNMGNIQLGQPISSETEFAKVTDSTSDTARGVEIAANVIGTLGGVGSNATRKFEFKAEPAKFRVASLEALNKANEALTAKMQSLK